MTFSRKQREQLPEPDSRTVGDFRSDGSWNPSAQASERGPRHRFINELCRVRRAARLSPAQIADQIIASPHAEMFGELDQWQQITTWDNWAFAWTRTSADETVKRAGLGAVEQAHWEQGDWIKGEDSRPFVHADREHVASFVASIAERLTLDRPAWAQPADPVKPRASDQEFFEGKAT